jgi:RNA polymerase sigma-70 factor (ECF subfamily)
MDRISQLNSCLSTSSTERLRIARVNQRSEVAIWDEQLIAAVAQGDYCAFERLYDQYAPMVFGLALKMLHDHEAAAEAVQEVFWRVWQRAGSFDCNRSFAPWLFRIAHNYCIDELRRWRMQPQLIYEDDEHPLLSVMPTDTDVGEMVLQAERRRIVVQALQQLPIEQRQALELGYFRGLTQQEIADYLGDPLGTVKTRMRLGLQKLSTMLQQQGLMKESRHL